MSVRLLALVAVAWLLVGCAAAPTMGPPTDGPTEAPTAGATNGAAASPGPSPSLPQPTTPLEPTPLESAPATVPPGAGEWQPLADFPAGDALLVADVAWTGDGFVAVGAEPAEPADPDGLRQGVVWQSADGLAWQRSADPAFGGASLDGIAELGGTLYAFGFLSTCPALDDECPELEESGNAAWRGDPARGWTRLELPASLRTAEVDGVGTVGELLFARGTFGDEVTPALWLSADGTDWRMTTALAELDYLSAVAAVPSGIVVLGTVYDAADDTIEARAAHSPDGTEFRVVQSPAGLSAALESVASGPAGLLALGNSLGGDDAELEAVALVSTDGLAWSSLPADGLRGSVVAGVHAAPAGYLALGADLLPSGAVAGRAWSSADGSSWLALAPFAEPPFSSISASALGRPGLVVFAVDASSDEAALRGWLLPAQALAGR